MAGTQEVEAQVATTISRGETLLLLLHRGSAEQAQAVHHMLARLREDWARLRAEADRLKAEARREEKEVERFTSLCSGLLVWLADVERRVEGAGEDAVAREAVLREMEGRKEELERTNSLGLELREQGLLEGLEGSLTSCNYRWSQAQADCRGSRAAPGAREAREAREGAYGVRRGVRRCADFKRDAGTRRPAHTNMRFLACPETSRKIIRGFKARKKGEKEKKES